MGKLSKGMSFFAQLVAVCIVLSFVMGMQWQEDFYSELGFPWVSGYSNYLDTMQAGIPTLKYFLYFIAAGSGIIWALSHWRPELAAFLLLLVAIIFTISADMVASWFHDLQSPEFLMFRSYYLLATSGFTIGGVAIAIISTTSNHLDGATADATEPHDRKLRLFYTLILISIIMMAIVDSPSSLGQATARKAILNGFNEYSQVIDADSKTWRLIGFSQGHLVLARTDYKNNTIQIKLASDTSELVINPSTPIRILGTAE